MPRRGATTESRYLAEVRRLPRPSDAQVETFVEYVTVAHSWYKHLPLKPPGKLFLFYLNPNTGREWVATMIGGGYRDRTNDTPTWERFHYTWRPTAEYVELFGHLDYFASAGTSFLVPTRGGVLDTRARPKIQAADGEWLELPDAIHTVGAAHLTAAIHPLAWVGGWRRQLRSHSDVGSTYPDRAPSEQIILAAQREMSRRLGAHADAGLPRGSPDPEELKEWMPATASKQTERMREVVGRVLEWVYDRS
jgi:hypothetical protein